MFLFFLGYFTLFSSCLSFAQVQCVVYEGGEKCDDVKWSKNPKGSLQEIVGS